MDGHEDGCPDDVRLLLSVRELDVEAWTLLLDGIVKSAVAEQRLIESKGSQLDPVGEDVKVRTVARRSVFLPLAVAAIRHGPQAGRSAAVRRVLEANEAHPTLDLLRKCADGEWPFACVSKGASPL